MITRTLKLDGSELRKLGQSPVLAEVVSDFASSYARMSPADVASILLLSDSAWRLVWKPDALSDAIREWRANVAAGHEYAHAILKERISNAMQNRTFPRVIVRRIEQLRPELFPIQSMEACPMLRAGANRMPGLYDPKVPEAEDLYYTHCYFRGLEWLKSLPVTPTEIVCVARDPSQTFVVTWECFSLNWDAFHCDRFCSLNVCGENDDWFLMMNSERILIFGCTEARAAEFELSRLRQIPHPIDYMSELGRRRHAFERFKYDLQTTL